MCWGDGPLYLRGDYQAIPQETKVPYREWPQKPGDLRTLYHQAVQMKLKNLNGSEVGFPTPRTISQLRCCASQPTASLQQMHGIPRSLSCALLLRVQATSVRDIYNGAVQWDSACKSSQPTHASACARTYAKGGGDANVHSCRRCVWHTRRQNDRVCFCVCFTRPLSPHTGPGDRNRPVG
jgi:hypothetical protein